jgi:hypothetical protein
MARQNFSNSVYLSKATALVTATPLTLACFVNPAALSTDAIMVCIGQSGSDANMWDVQIPAASKQVWAETGSTAAGFDHSLDGLSAITTGAFVHVAAVFASPTSRIAYRNGVAGATNATSITPTSLSPGSSVIGNSTGKDNRVNGTVAWVGIWAAALLQPEIAALSQGCHPRRIRPASLVAALNLTGGLSPEPDMVNATGWTVTGALTEIGNPRIFY